jgi:hypothetical protein
MRVDAPTDWVEAVSHLELPKWMDRRLQKLMDAGNEGQLTADEREELKSLVDWTERFSLIRAEALQLLRSAHTEGHA